jgi:hypothetical protein
VQGVQVRRGIAPVRVAAHTDIQRTERVLHASGYKAADGNVNRCSILNTHGPWRVVKLIAIVVAVISERIGAIADACAVALGVEELAYIPILPADIDKHPPPTGSAAAFAIILDGKIMQSHLESAHAGRVV